MRRTVETLLATALGALFIYAGAIKIPDPAALLADVEGYRLVSHRVAWVAALLLPPLEVLCGAGLWIPPWRRTSALLLGFLMAVFTAALLAAWARGLDIHCGCFGSADEETASNLLLLAVRDLAILGGLGFVWWSAGRQGERNYSDSRRLKSNS